MSLVNETLKALERREALPQDETDPLCRVELGPSNDIDDHRSVLFWFTSLFLLLGVAVLGYWLVVSNDGKLQRSYPVATLPASLTTNIVKPAPVLEVPSTSESMAEASAVSARINLLLHEARLALLNDRLTDPVSDNAYTRFQSVLLLDPAHHEALAGVQSIVARYMEFARETNQRGELNQAENYLSKAKLISRQYPSIASWFSSQPSILPLTQTLGNKSQQLASIPESLLTQSASPADGKLLVRPSDKFQDEKVSNQAALLMAKQQEDEAEQLLLGVLAENPHYNQSRKRLFNLYLHRRDTNAAEQLLSQFDDITEPKRVLMRAQINVQQQQWQQAAETLESHLQSVANDAEFLSLLAAVYYQLGRHEDAITQYQSLLKIDNRSAPYWLGLAVSSDALADEPGALQAFRNAALYGGLDDNTLAYIEQRIQALAGILKAG